MGKLLLLLPLHTEARLSSCNPVKHAFDYFDDAGKRRFYPMGGGGRIGEGGGGGEGRGEPDYSERALID